MEARPPIYGLDIETDTSVNGLDPAVGGIVTVALSSPSGDEVFDGPEIDMLAAVDARLAGLAPGVLATWNGAFFDLPFLADRAAYHGVALGLRLTLGLTPVEVDRARIHDLAPDALAAYVASDARLARLLTERRAW
jgi:DNA polymerase elongation subunit (family B)